MICKYCGTKNEDECKCCRVCGMPLVNDKQEESDKKSYKYYGTEKPAGNKNTEKGHEHKFGINIAAGKKADVGNREANKKEAKKERIIGVAVALVVVAALVLAVLKGIVNLSAEKKVAETEINISGVSNDAERTSQVNSRSAAEAEIYNDGEYEGAVRSGNDGTDESVVSNGKEEHETYENKTPNSSKTRESDAEYSKKDNETDAEAKEKFAEESVEESMTEDNKYETDKEGGTKPELPDEESKPIKNGWIKDESGCYYYQNDNMITGWIRDGNKWYYCDADGRMVLNAWRTISGENYYFGNDGSMAVNTTTPDGYTVDESGKRVTEDEESYDAVASLIGTYKYDDGNEYYEDFDTGDIEYHYTVTLSMNESGKYTLTVNDGKNKTKSKGTYKYNPNVDEEVIYFSGSELDSEGRYDGDGQIEVYVNAIGDYVCLDK